MMHKTGRKTIFKNTTTLNISLIVHIYGIWWWSEEKFLSCLLF